MFTVHMTPEVQPMTPPAFGCRGCKCFIWLLLGPDKLLSWENPNAWNVDGQNPESYWPACQMRDGNCFVLHECRPECDDWNQTPKARQ